MFAKYSVGAQRAAPAPARHSLCPKTSLYSASINKLVQRRHECHAGASLIGQRSKPWQPAAEVCTGEKGGLPPISASPVHSKIGASPKGNWLAVPFFRVLGLATRAARRRPLAPHQPPPASARLLRGPVCSSAAGRRSRRSPWPFGRGRELRRARRNRGRGGPGSCGSPLG